MSQKRLEGAKSRAEQALSQIQEARSRLQSRLTEMEAARPGRGGTAPVPPNGEMEEALARATRALRQMEEARLAIAEGENAAQSAASGEIASLRGCLQEAVSSRREVEGHLTRMQQELGEERARRRDLAREMEELRARLAVPPPPTSPPHHAPQEEGLSAVPGTAHAADAAEASLARRKLAALEETRLRLERELFAEQQRSRGLADRASALEAQVSNLSVAREALFDQMRSSRQELDQLQERRSDWEARAAAHAGDEGLAARIRAQADSLAAGAAGDEERRRLEAQAALLVGERGRLAEELAASKESLLRILRGKVDLEVRLHSLQQEAERLAAQKGELEALREEKSRSTGELTSLRTWLEQAIARRDQLSGELERARADMEGRLAEFSRTTGEIDGLRGRLEAERQEKHQTLQRVVILEKRLEEKYPLAGRKILKTFESFQEAGQDPTEALVKHFDYLFNFKHGYPFLDVNNLRSLTRKFIVALRADPASALDLTYYSTNGYLREHSFNVAKLAVYLGMHQGYRDPVLEVLGVCALLHDIGMITVPETVLHKAGRLEGEELARIREHPAKSVRLFEDMEAEGDLVAELVSTVLAQHHEKEDGSGYPHARKGGELHEFSKLLHIADAYAAMISPRAWRKSLLPHEALKRIIGEATSGQLNLELVRTFVRALSLYPIGSFVALGSGERAKVVAADPADPRRPVVKLVRDAAGEPLTRPVYLDLRGEKKLEIVRAVRSE